MSNIRDKYNIPDEYVGNEHLKNWFIKNLGMKDLIAVFIDPDFIKDEITKKSIYLIEGKLILVYNSHKIKINITEGLLPFIAEKFGVGE